MIWIRLRVWLRSGRLEPALQLLLQPLVRPPPVVVTSLKDAAAKAGSVDRRGDEIGPLATEVVVAVNRFDPSQFGMSPTSLALVEHLKILVNAFGMAGDFAIELHPLHHNPDSEVVGVILGARLR